MSGFVPALQPQQGLWITYRQSGVSPAEDRGRSRLRWVIGTKRKKITGAPPAAVGISYPSSLSRRREAEKPLDPRTIRKEKKILTGQNEGEASCSLLTPEDVRKLTAGSM